MEVGKEQDDGEEEDAFRGNDEEERLHPLYIFFLIKEHPVDEAVEHELHDEIDREDSCEEAEDLIVGNGERLLGEVA